MSTSLAAGAPPKLVPQLREADTDWKRFLINHPFEPFDARKYLEFRLFWAFLLGDS